MPHINFKYGNASAKLEYLEGHIYSLRNMYSHTPRQGHATEVMKSVIKYADQRNLTILLVVQAYGPVNRNVLNNKQLVAFYEKYGFESNPDYVHVPHMIRYPSQEKPGS